MTAVRPELFEGVVESFFEAAAVPSLWPEALHALALACGAEGAVAHCADGLKTLATVGSEGTAGLYHDFIKRWRAPELNSHRARGLALIERGWRGVLTEQDCFTPDEIKHDPFQQEFMIPAGFSSFAGAILGKGTGIMLSTSIYRRINCEPYSRGEKYEINKLVSYMRGAADLALRVGMKSIRHISDAFASAGHPIVLIGRNGTVVYANTLLERLLGDCLNVKNCRLGACHPDSDRMLAEAIAAAIAYDGVLREPLRSVALRRRDGRRPVIAHVAPVVGQANDFLTQVAAIVTLSDLEERSQGPSEQLLSLAFALTPAEARLARQIAAGRTIHEIARSDQTSRETLRSRLKTVFQKTGTNRQPELVALLLQATQSGSPAR